MKRQIGSSSFGSLLATTLIWLNLSPRAQAFPVITNVVETGGDNEATDTIPAKWTGVTFTNGVANEPVLNKAANDPYTVGYFNEDAPAYVDRAHQWNGASVSLPLPRYLVGGEYIMSGNDNRDNNTYQLAISIADEAYVYMLVDNRLNDGNAANPPDFSTGLMSWLATGGWVAATNGLNRAGNPAWPDEIGVDEGTVAADLGVGPGAAINNWSSVYVKRISAGTFSILQANNGGRNMYGVVIVPVPKAPTVTKSVGDLLGVRFEVTDGSLTALNANSIVLKLDGTTLSPTITKNGIVTTVKYTVPAPLPSGSAHTAELTFADTATPPVTATETLNFTVETYQTLTAADAIALSSVDTLSSGLTIRMVQGPDSAHWPGTDLPTSTQRAEDQLAGRLLNPVTGQPLANAATPGPGPGGTYVTNMINWNQELNADGTLAQIGNFQSNSVPSFPDSPIPGIANIDAETGATNRDNFAAELITYLELSAGLHRLGVNSDDGFRVTAGANPRDPAALELGVFNGNRGSADSLFYVLVQADGIYPVRLIWYEGGGGANLEFFSIDLATSQKILVNDRNNPAAIKAYSALTTVARPYVSVSPLHNSTNVYAGTTIQAQIADQTTAVAPGSITLALNGTSVTPAINKNGNVTSVVYDPPGLLPSGSTNTVTLVYSDSGSPAVTVTTTWQFVVQDYSSFPIIPASYSVSAGSVDLASSGFAADVYIMSDQFLNVIPRTGFANNSQVEAAEKQIARGYIDPATGRPYDNLIPPGAEPDGRYGVDLLNWNQQAPAAAGGFTTNVGFTDAEIPALPTGDWDWIATEITTFLDLKAGLYRFGVNCDDGFKVTTARDIHDLFALQLALRSPGGGAADVLFDFRVEQDGIYPIRLLWWEGTGGASVEFFVVDQNSGAARLINDRNTYFAVKGYRRFTGAPIPYVKSVKPRINETVVPADTAIEATIVNLGTGSVGMFLDGTSVTPTTTTTSTNSTVRYTPPASFAAGSTHTVGLTYGTVSNSWSFTVGRGPKVLLVVADPTTLNPSDAAIQARLASFGFDILSVGDSASVTADADNAVLVLTSATVGSGNVADKFRLVPVPVINWENALLDNYLMTLDTTNDHNAINGQTNIIITDAAHPLAAGLSAGQHTVTTGPAIFSWGLPAASARTVATLADGSGRACLVAINQGDLLIDGVTAAPARRVHIFLDTDTFALLNSDGLKLFDAAVSWASNRTLNVPPRFDLPVSSNGQVTISWTGNGTLQEATDLTGNSTDWSDVNPPPSGKTFTVAVGSGARKFYRIRP